MSNTISGSDINKMLHLLVTNTSMKPNTKRKIEQSKILLEIYNIDPNEEELYRAAFNDIINNTITQDQINIIINSEFRPKPINFYKEWIKVLCPEIVNNELNPNFDRLINFISSKENEQAKINNNKNLLRKLFKIFNP